jgi:hypothetical protein
MLITIMQIFVKTSKMLIYVPKAKKVQLMLMSSGTLLNRALFPLQINTHLSYKSAYVEFDNSPFLNNDIGRQNCWKRLFTCSFVVTCWSIRS